MTQWVSFPEIKARVSIADILSRYGLVGALRKQGSDELVGGCPFHEGKSREPFHVSLSKNAFRCFAPHCGKQGNILDLVMFKEGTANIREAALLIQGWFPSAGETAPGSTESVVKPEAGDRVPEDLPDAQAGQGSSINPPLAFMLKGLDAGHPYLKDRGLKRETIDDFCLGYCSRGVMKNRIAIPVHNERGELVAYAGRWPGDDGWPEGEEKYKLPAGFKKSHVLFNLHRAKEKVMDNGLILTEGFFDCIWLHQLGYLNVVALMGSSMSERQRDLLVGTLGGKGKVALLLDNDEAGRKCEAKCLDELSNHLFVKKVRLPADCNQPDNLTEPELHQLLG